MYYSNLYNFNFYGTVTLYNKDTRKIMKNISMLCIQGRQISLIYIVCMYVVFSKHIFVTIINVQSSYMLTQ